MGTARGPRELLAALVDGLSVDELITALNASDMPDDGSASEDDADLYAVQGLARLGLAGWRQEQKADADDAGLTVRLTNVSVTRKEVTPEQAACPICGAELVGRLLKPPKSRAGRRWVPLAGPAQAALARYREAQREEREFLGVDYDDHDLVFCTPSGVPLRPDRVTVAFGRHVATCGLPVIRLHATRHGACSLLLAGGVPIEVVQMILGSVSNRPALIAADRCH